MRVLLLSLWRPRKGGIVTRVQNLAANSKNDFRVVTCRDPDAPREYNVARVPCTGVPLLRAALYVLLGFFRSIFMRFDVIHAHYAVPQGLLGVMLKKVRRKPLVTTLHGSDVMVLGDKRPARPLVKCVIKNSDRLIAVSEAIKRGAVALGVREEKIKVVYGGVSKPEKTTVREGAPKVLFVGALVRQKGVDILLRAFSMLGIPEAGLVLVGEGKEKETLEALASNLGLRGVEFLPPVDDIGKIIEEASVLVLPSREEGFGLVLLEAMARGVPVVASRAGGITEIIRDGENGLLFKGEDYRGLSRAILNLIKDQKLRDRLTANARRDAKRFSWAKMAEEVDAVYAEIS